SFLLWPYELSFRFGLLVSIFCFFDYGQNVSRRILEPGNGRTISAHDPLLVRLEVGQIVNLETDTSLRQLINDKIDIFHWKIQNRERSRNMVRLRINENIIAAGE